MHMHRYNYIITLRHTSYSTINAISLLMLVLALALFTYTAWAQWGSAVYHNAAILYAVISSIIVAWCIYCLSFAKKLKRIPYYRIALATAAVGWFTEPVNNYWIGALYLLAALAERQVKFPMEIGIDETGITFNSLPARSRAWNEIENMVLKDGILTIDYKNNKIFQKEIETDVSNALEQEVTAYCRQQLSTPAASATASA